ncbi:nucleotidyltransferase domain-containing protein [Crocosphaera sp.]|uniref:nucleotidyltransferase family protein n=1 Tax=Crocosphaera sp. TaxID=2729996 RepID=UPI00262E4F21|nr:nucleotidyltransferase domain-containing protein [Crocosphaera sp.]MDJ0582010.1 nucleotidyltransferase domain-containing protein [Crocosphaera sp.]
MTLETVYKRLKISPETLAKLCQENKIKELAVFGSILREDFNENSDIDLLVSYQPTAKRGLIQKIQMIETLKLLFNRDVDLVSKKAIENSHNWIRRQNILDSAEVIYAEGSRNFS